MGVIYITHRLDELRSVGDRVTMLRDGATVHSCALSELTTGQFIQHMVGRDVTSLFSASRSRPATSCCASRTLRGPDLHDISFTLRAGEIVGMAGLIGAGRTETVPRASSASIRWTADAFWLTAARCRSGRRATRWPPASR